MASGGLGIVAFALAVPLVAGRPPTSLLPPGFGDPSSQEPETEEPIPAQSPRTDGQAGPARPGLQLELPGYAEDGTGVLENAAEAGLSPEELAERLDKYDLPDGARRSLDRIGPLTPATGGLPADAFGGTSGQYLATIMRETRAPLVSRWGSILLRRALLSSVDTPSDINGADWAAERAWLLVRMGEADPARMMVQSVDADNFTRRLYAVAMQAYLASADPVGLCPHYRRAQQESRSQGWQMAEAICASFAAEQGRASAILNQAQRRGRISGIDYRLTEKLVGAGAESRRSVKIEWDGVEKLTAWRYGLATALNVDIPAPLMERAGSHVRAWQARAPMISLATRLPAAETATRLGIFSSAALVDFYSELDGDDSAPGEFRRRANALRLAYGAPSVGERIDAMRDLWDSGSDREFLDLLLVSRSAASLPVADVNGEDASNLIAAMLSAGYDISAARWSRAGDALGSSGGAEGWALLAVGAPKQTVTVDADRLRAYVGNQGLRGRMLVAGLAGLGRIEGETLQAAIGEAKLSLQPHGRWQRAIEIAARRREKGTVALLSAVGMQARSWDRMPPEHVYHIVSALRRAGLDAEARMIAAEAIMRS